MGIYFGIPADGVRPHAIDLEHSSRARRGLRDARIVVAVYPDGTQELLFGGDDLTHQIALLGPLHDGDVAKVDGLLLIRVDRSDHADLIALHLCRQKPHTRAQVSQMIEGTHLP
jgi:hypothetical protein